MNVVVDVRGRHTSQKALRVYTCLKSPPISWWWRLKKQTNTHLMATFSGQPG